MISMSKEDAKSVMKALDDFDGWADHGCPPSTEVAVKIMRGAITEREPTDSMGMPLSCGKPLCAPGDHHPLCKQAQPAPVAWVDLLKQAEEIVRSKSLWKKYIDGTPLANDIAVWMASFAHEHIATPPAAPVQEFVCSTGLCHYKEQPAPTMPMTDGVFVPLTILESAEASIGSFCSDHGWTDEDMRNMDNLSACIAQHKAAQGIAKGGAA